MRLLKYDFLSQMKTILPGIGLAILSAIVHLALSFVIDNIDLEKNTIFMYSLYIAQGITNYAVNALIFYGFFMISTDFYRGIFGKEGYLTHTLPVKTSRIIQSRMLVGSLSMILCLLVVGLMNYLITLQKFGNSYLFHNFSSQDFQIIAIVGCALLIQGGTQLATMYLSMSLAHLTKHPIPFTVVFYLILNNTLTFLPLITTFVLMFQINMDNFFYLLVYATLSGLLCYIFYCITLHIAEKKLNLV